ncbi:sugar kinase [bacterium 336/3]|nr:sugar kinase [bacterium 336/3]
MATIEKAIIVKSKTRLELLTEQYNTVQQAKFSIERKRENLEVQSNFLSKESLKSVTSNRAKKKEQIGSGEFSDFDKAHKQQYNVLEMVQNITAKHLKVKVIDNTILPSFIFSENDLIIVVGQDGLVANTAKYTNNLPIIGVNPDASRFDGVLLPFNAQTFEQALWNVLKGNYNHKLVTMAEVLLDDGQRLLAFNDFFIGPISHSSARYLITYQDITETHSSSGIIISTGAGATGWMSSLFNMANGIHQAFGGGQICERPKVPLDTEQLIFIVREPFISKTSQAQVSAGIITPQKELVVESLMEKTGIIFSDGIEADKLRFNSGSIAKIGIAKEKAKLVLP